MSLLAEIPYRPDSSRLFDALAQRAWAAFLDSGRPQIAQGRYDILTADPYITLVTRGLQTRVSTPAGRIASGDDPFALVRRYLGRPVSGLAGLPFSGGAVGWFAYDLGRRIERLPIRSLDADQTPELAVGIYDWALVVDHRLRRSQLVGRGRDPATRVRWASLVDLFRAPPVLPHREAFQRRGPVRSGLDRAAYAAAFARIQDYIRDGDCYQVNLARPFEARVRGDPWDAYRALRLLNPAPFSAYLTTPYGQALSSSPERFLRLRHGRAQTCPIKGTRPRGATPARDRALARALVASPKDRAENLMIVDLLRNDLGRVCVPGSVRVPHLFRVRSFATVHHLVSIITGRLGPGQDATSLLRACFPGGSITGAPKIRAMQIIEELEPRRRGIYCGAIGYLGFDGCMDTSIAIRTLVHRRGRVDFWAGGGIVADSDPEAEFQETGHKAAALLRLLEGS
jgi:para-aminobenzoate synthetase component 1